MGRGVFTIEQEGSVDQQGESENLRGLKVSQWSARLKIQMNKVLQVSMILLAVALMLLVTLIPKKLKPPIETMIATEENATAR